MTKLDISAEAVRGKSDYLRRRARAAESECRVDDADAMFEAAALLEAQQAEIERLRRVARAAAQR